MALDPFCLNMVYDQAVVIARTSLEEHNTNILPVQDVTRSASNARNFYAKKT